jgi:hypothetical protein
MRLRWALVVAVALAAGLAVTVTASGALRSERPRCFGAAARDARHPCRNPALARMVVPTPRDARQRLNAPCSLRRDGPLSVCEFAAPAAGAASAIALVGDSHAAHWRAALDPVARARGWHGLSLVLSGCPLSKAARALRPAARFVGCVRWKRQVFAWFRRHPEVRIVFVSQLSGGTGVRPSGGRSEFATAMAGYVAAWQALPRTVRHVVVIRDSPKDELTTAGCLERALARHSPAGERCATARARRLDPDPAADAARRLRSPRVRVIDLTRFFCDRLRCYPVVGGALVHKDVTHLTAVYVATLAPYLGRAVDTVLGRRAA